MKIDKNDPTLRKLSVAHILDRAGDATSWHEDRLPHTHILLMGAVRMEIEGAEGVDYTAPATMPIAGDVSHRFVALVDDSCFVCAFPFER